MPVDVFYDATPSMAGFLKEGGGYYDLATQTVVEAAPTGKEINFFKVSSAESGSVTGFDSSQDAGEEVFYSQGDTDLQVALDSADTGHVSVVLTDLFQTNQDVVGLNRSIATKFIREGQAIGIIALRLGFEGKVYDVGRNSRAFDYSGERPVYLLVFGPNSNVRQYMHRIEERRPSARFLLLSDSLLERPLALENGEVLDYKNLVPVEFGFVDASHPGQFEIDNAQASQHFAEVCMPVATNPYVPKLRKGELQARVTSGHLREEGEFENLPVGRAARMAEVVASNKRMAFSDEGVRLRLEVSPTEMARRGIYRFDATLRPRNVPLPNWVRAWDMDRTKIQDWVEAPETFEGSTTSRFEQFVSALWRSVVEQQDPVLGQLKFYVERS